MTFSFKNIEFLHNAVVLATAEICIIKTESGATRLSLYAWIVLAQTIYATFYGTKLCIQPVQFALFNYFVDVDIWGVSCSYAERFRCSGFGVAVARMLLQAAVRWLRLRTAASRAGINLRQTKSFFVVIYIRQILFTIVVTLCGYSK